MQAMATNELWPIDKLIPLARNPRTYSEAQIAVGIIRVDSGGVPEDPAPLHVPWLSRTHSRRSL